MFLSIVCQKGGVGKTTLSINISDIYSKKGKKVLLIDLDPQGNATTYVHSKEKSTFDSLDLLENKKKLQINELPEVRENLYLVPSNQDVKRLISSKLVAGSILRKRRDSEEFRDFDHIIIDTPPSMSSVVSEAICISDYYLIPTRAEFLSAEGVGQAIKYAKETISNRKEANPIFLGVVLNSVDKRRTSFKSFQSELKLILGDKLFESSISQLSQIAEAPFYGRTLSEHNANGKAHKEVLLLVEEIERKIEEYL